MPLPEPSPHTYHTLLSAILDRGIKLADVVAHRAFSTSEEASAIIQALSKAAVELGKSSAVEELGMATALGSTGEDPLKDVPEVIPVVVPVSQKNFNLTCVHALAI
jgi:DNA-directed RNA polymerase